MSNPKKKKLSTSIFAHTSGCGRCSKSKLSDIVEPDAKPSTAFAAASGHHQESRLSYSSSGHRNDELSLSTRIHSPVVIGIGDSIAIERDSDNPYEDFRRSMFQMIIEKRIYSNNGLQELLNCFLDLNSPYHHEIIVRAFTDIWNEIISHRLWISSNNNTDRNRRPPAKVDGSERWHVRQPSEGH